MKTTDFIQQTLEMSTGWVMGLLQDMQDAPLTFPTSQGGNHPLWVLGHLVFSEAQLISEYARGESNPVAQWQEIFGPGSQPVADAARYPSFGEVAGKAEEIRSGTLAYLSSLTDDDLDQVSHAPEEVQQYFGTVAKCFSALCVHTTFHGGQVADARRSAGRPPMMA